MLLGSTFPEARKRIPFGSQEPPVHKSLRNAGLYLTTRNPCVVQLQLGQDTALVVLGTGIPFEPDISHTRRDPGSLLQHHINWVGQQKSVSPALGRWREECKSKKFKVILSQLHSQFKASLIHETLSQSERWDSWSYSSAVKRIPSF